MGGALRGPGVVRRYVGSMFRFECIAEVLLAVMCLWFVRVFQSWDSVWLAALLLVHGATGFRAHVDVFQDLVFVQNRLERHEVAIGDIAWVDVSYGLLRPRPRLVLRSGASIPVSAYALWRKHGLGSGLSGGTNQDAIKLAGLLGLPYRAG